MSEGTISNRVLVKIEDMELPQELEGALSACWVESSVNLPAAFHVSFLDEKRLLVKNYPELLRVGAKVAVYGVAGGQGTHTPLVTGEATALEVDYDGSVTATVLRGLDHAFRMVRQRRATGYQHMTAAEIVAKLAKQDKVTIGVIEPTGYRYPVITQPNISDWEFVKYLAERNDMRADFDNLGKLRFRKAEPAEGEVIVGDAQHSTRVLDMGTNVLRCRTGITASDQVSRVTSRGWDMEQKRELLEHSTALSSTEFDIGTTPGEVVATFGDVTRTETGTPYYSERETIRAAASLASDITSSFAELEIAIHGEPTLLPGLVIALKDAGPPFDGTYTISATRHEFDPRNGYTTWIWVTGRQVRSLYGLASDGDPPMPRIHGVVNAIVDDINDPSQQGRVRLRFPWFDDTYVTDWVRTVQFGGYRGGGVISPEIDDEVLVAFDRGSMDHPYVLGGLYSGNPENSPSKHDTDLHTGGRLNRRSLVSRSGHRLELLDSEEPPRRGVRLQSANEKLTVFLDENKTQVTVSSDGTVEVSGRTEVTVRSDGSVTINGPKGVSVRSDGSVTVNGIGGVTVTSADSVRLDAPMVNIAGMVNIEGTVSIEGDASVNGSTTLTGATTITGLTTVNGMVI